MKEMILSKIYGLKMNIKTLMILRKIWKNELRPEDQEEKHIDTLEHSGIKYQKLWKMADPSIYVRNVDLEISKETK